jgi:hypothetical protein
MATGLVKKNQTVVTRQAPGAATQPSNSVPGALNSGPFTINTAPPPPQVTSAPSTAVGTSQYTGLAKNSSAKGTGVPQSFIDGIANLAAQDTQAGHTQFNYNGQNYSLPGGGTIGAAATGQANPPMSQQQFDDTVQKAWNSLPPDKKQQYIQQDQTAVAGINTGNITGYATQTALGAPAINTAAANKTWNTTVQPALNKSTVAQDAQVTGDHQAEDEIAGNAAKYGTTLDQNQALRMAGIKTTNDANSGLAADYMGATQAANAQNLIYGQQWTDAANSTNANQTGLFNNLSSANAATSANQTGLFNQNASTLNGITSNQNQLLSNLGGQVSSSNAQQNQILGEFKQQLSAMNKQDQAAYLQYISETNPLMAQMIAQGSNPAYVANQENAVEQYKKNYNPEVTDQERLLAELARRKFESDDQSSREAQMQQLAGRGLKSGGLVIAGTQSAREQNSQDRQLNELGLSAQAVSRAERNRAGYTDASATLRNADDAMRNFQDQYAQNDAVRRGNLAQQRDQQELNTSWQQTQRDKYGYDAGSQTVRDNFGRNLDYYNAGTQTNEDNTGRANDIFNNGTMTNTTNSMRDQSTFNAGTTTNNDNFGRTTGAITTNIGINQGNLGNTLTATGVSMGTNSANDTRYQGGLDHGDLNAGSELTASNIAPGLRVQNRAAEVSSAQGGAQTAANAAGIRSGIQTGLTKEQIDALEKVLGYKIGDQQVATAKGMG